MLFNSEGRLYDFSDFLMDEEFIREITCHETAGRYLIDLKNLHPDLSEEIDLAVKVLYGMKNISAGSSIKGKQETWDRIADEAAHARRRVSFFRAAATFIALAGLSAAFYFSFIQTGSSRIEKYAGKSPVVFEEPRLILSDGNSYYISDDESAINYSENGTDIIINDSVKISQDAGSDAYNELVIPYGSYSSLTLSDGTMVWVNAGSRLVFPPKFTGKTREVFVEGEAYFEVAKDLNKPFYVKTSRFTVEVKGTKFSVQADEEDSLYTALLLEGKVTLTTHNRTILRGGEFDLPPGLMARVNSEGYGFDITRVEHPENYIAWKNGYLVFNDEPIGELLIRVARYYNVEIETREVTMNIRISGKLDLKDDPERVLRGLSVMANCNLFNDDERYVFY